MKKILLFLILIFLISNCEYFTLLSQKEWVEKSEQEESVIIYAAGAQYDDDAANYLPCYWIIKKDGFEKINLENYNNLGISQSIYVDGDTVYNCGFDDPGGLYRACYWINQKKYNLEVKDPLVYSSLCYQIIFKNGVIFTTGFEESGGNYDPISWINQKMNIIHISPPNSLAECIFVQQDSSNKHSFYFGGMYAGKPCYWHDHQINFLEDDDTTNMKVKSIFVVGKTVYSCGNKTLPTPEVACYWKNKKLTYLPGGTDARSLFISNEDVYIAGINETSVIEACYWKNNKKKLLPDSYFSGGDSIANSIYILNNNIYIGGRDDDGSGSNSVAWYYINGEKFIFNSSENAGIVSIFVKDDNED